MPEHSIYTLAREFPWEIRCGSVVYKLDLVPGDIRDLWVFRARKLVPPACCEIARSRFGRRALLASLHHGILIEEDTAASRLLDRLVRDGHATKRPAVPRDLR